MTDVFECIPAALPVPADALELGVFSAPDPLFDFLDGPSFGLNDQPAGAAAAGTLPDQSPAHSFPSPQPTASSASGSESGSDDVSVHGSPSHSSQSGGIISKLPNRKRGPEIVVKQETIKEEPRSPSFPPSSPTHPICLDEERVQKRQRRLIKNRESAQLSRQRKKVYIEELEKRVSTLAQQTEDLGKKNGLLTKENAALKEEVARLQRQLHAHEARGPVGSKAAKTAGIALLVVLFSFGLIFNSSPRLPFEDTLAGARTRFVGRNLASLDLKRSGKEESGAASDKEEEITLAVPAPKFEFKQATRKQQLPAADLPKSAPLSQQLGSFDRAASLDFVLRHHKSKRSEMSAPAVPAQEEEESQASLSASETGKRRKVVKVAEESHQEQETPVIRPPNNEVAAKDSLVPLSGRPGPYPIVSTRTRPTTQYLYCPDAQQVTIAGEDEAAPSIPPNYVALLIPGEMLNSTFAPHNSLVEVTCSVASMNFYPLYRQPLADADEAAGTALQRA